MKRNERNDRFNTYFPLHTAKKFKLLDVQNSNDIINSDIQSVEDESNNGYVDFEYWRSNDKNVLEDSCHRILLSNSDCQTSLVVESFNFIEIVYAILDFMKDAKCSLEKDDSIPLFNTSEITKGDWARGFHSLCSNFSISEKAENALINYLYNTTGNVINFPVALTNSGQNRARKLLCQHVDELDDKNDDLVDGDDSIYKFHGSKYYFENQGL